MATTAAPSARTADSDRRTRAARSLAVSFYIGVGVMLLPMVNVAAAAYVTNAELIAQFEDVQQDAGAEALPLRRLQVLLAQAPAEAAVLSGTPQDVAAWEGATAAIDLAFARYRPESADRVSAEIVAAAAVAWGQARDDVETRLRRPLEQRRLQGEGALRSYDSAVWRIIGELERSARLAETEFSALLAAGEGGNRQARNANVVPMVLGLGVAAFAGQRLARHVLVPLRALKQAAERLGDGQLSYRVNLDRRDELGSLAGAFNDMAGDLERSRDLITHQALHDPLTALANRTLLVDRIEQASAGARRRSTTIALLLLDLDGFKAVNDSLGHSAGDRVLVEMARRVAAALPKGNSAARLGGDEFAVLLEDVDADGALAVAELLIEALGVPLPGDGHAVTLGVSIGVALSAGDLGADELLRNADLAMYRAKQHGKGRCELFEEGMHAAAVARVRLEAQLREAMEHGELRVHYQPTVDLRTRRIAGCEALVRWEHPQRGLILPGEFIGLAEETGLIVPLGAWVLRTACQQLRDWGRRFPRHPLTMSVNLSARQLQHPGFAAYLEEVLRETGVDADSLVLEITESVMLAEGEGARRRLEDLKRLGVRLALDDFGTGYSSLSYLERFPIDVLKVDKTFVDRLTVSEEGAALTRAIVALAEALHLQTVAEGIEDPRQVPILAAMGCDYGQGFHFGRGMTASRFAEVLSAQVAPLASAATAAPSVVDAG